MYQICDCGKKWVPLLNVRLNLFIYIYNINLFLRTLRHIVNAEKRRNTTDPAAPIYLQKFKKSLEKVVAGP